jgi:superfamily II DNA or RNA helicase/HKD family nuclease
MAGYPRGLYESLITEALAARLEDLGEQLHILRSELRPAEAADRITLHLGRVILRTVSSIDERNRVSTGIALARSLIDRIEEILDQPSDTDDRPISDGTVLRKILARLPDGEPERIAEPLIPLLDTALLTNAPGEPRVGHQILAEIESADRIDSVIAFIRRSGIAPLLDALQRHCQAGRPLRVLTTTYTGSTEARALRALIDLGAQVRVSYETNSTRLHAKAWLFHRESSLSTAYVGSSNLTHSAQVSGLEWNVRVSGARNPEVIEKIAAVFESYWNGGDFRPFEEEEFNRHVAGTSGPRTQILLSPLDVRAEPFQDHLLEQIAVSRERGFHRNLLVSATGTGKTVMAAIDYARLRGSLPRARLLFVAHREEILDQSLATFRQCLRDPSFGERWVGGNHPRRFDHVFASIQSIAAAGLRDLEPGHFDVVIIDEFHHAAAPSYQTLLDHVAPVELLGLTATPERSDGMPVLHWFGDRIAAELRLWDAIDQHRLVPFVYYGLHDGMDLRQIPWHRGRGYDTQGLSNLLTGNDMWARRVLSEVEARVDNPKRMRALAYCVSVAHARFMARLFNEAGIPSLAVWGDSPVDERREALSHLGSGRINVVFSVDLFNEGIDVPEIDTLLMLRPTDSPLLFMQQLGRGLRHSKGKSVCTVLDFVGHHRREFRFDRRIQGLLGGSRREVEIQVRSGFPFLPAGCHMELDPVASEIVLENLRRAIPSHWTAKVEELRRLNRQGGPVRLAAFLRETGLEIADVYAGNKSWSDLLSDAGAGVQQAGRHEQALRRACGRLLHINDRERLEAYGAFLRRPAPPEAEVMTERQRRLLRMLVASIADRVLDKSATLPAATALLWDHPQVRAELLELIDVLGEQIDHVQEPLTGSIDVPLLIHARYTRIEILAAFGIGGAAKVAPWQTGVYWAEDAAADLLAFTLDKTSGAFSPTTRYKDYAISRDLIHWESQSVTRADSETGRRYQEHFQRGSSIMLFARLRADERAFWFLGPATYVRHESERPMAVTWRLKHPLPGDLFATFAAAVA